MAMVLKVTTCWKESSWKMKHGSTITSQIANILIHPPKKIQKHPTAGSFMLTVFWDSQQLLLEHYQERGSTVNSAHYSGMQCDEIKPAI